MIGVVTAFDEHVGLGAVRDESDGTTYQFHCTQIADGSRSIAVGTRVTFTVHADRPRGPEAYAVTVR